ncbi:MAG: peptidoglycan-binding domain-containing protein, partial [Patescibacteria group bacterium]
MLKKFSLVLAVLAIVAVAGVSVASAQTATIQELQAQIQSLQAMLAQLGGAAAPAASVTFTRDLTVGSKGADVSALQQMLIDAGDLNIAAPTGYFGALTKAAVVIYQKDNGITPSVGYFGPKTRAFVAAMTPATPATPVTTPGTTLPAGCTSAVGFSPTTGTSCATTVTTTTTTGITTPGVEGSITVTANPTPGSGLTVREGDVKVPVLGLKLEAKLSDIAVQRIKVDLATSTIFYNKLFSKIYVLDGDTVLAESLLNSSTVVKDGTVYYITLAGFNFIVPKDSTKVLTLALDAQTSIDSSYDAVVYYGLLIPAAGVRGVDGAGLSQTGPTTALDRRTVTVGANSLADSATVQVSKNSTSPVAGTIIATEGSANDQKDKVPFLVFDVKTTKDK